jgi:hypothetical protein
VWKSNFKLGKLIDMQLVKRNISYPALLACCFLLVSVLNSCGQSGAKTETWPSPINLTAVINANGVTELSGLHWNPQLNRLYVVGDNGHLHVLELNKKTNDFSQIGEFSKLGGPEGITQVDYASNEFYTIDESHYEIRRFTHNPDFTNLKLAHKWNLLAEPSPMVDTGNDGPEGIVFVPDRYLSAVGFISSETDEKYTSKKGMGGLIFIAHQKKGLIWVFDLNPDKDDDFAFVGKYKTNRNESCDLAFDRSTGLLYILHNADENTIEVTDMSATQHSGKGKFIMKTEYKIPNPKGSINIEGLAIAPKFVNATNVSLWLCRDISKDEDSTDKNDCLWWFKPFTTEGNCVKNWNATKLGKK